MSDDNGLSDSEYDALLRDLEGRASSGGGSKADVDDDIGDIDSFLAELDAGDSSPSKPKGKSTATKDDDDALAREFAALEQNGELTAPKKADKRPVKEGKKKGAKPAKKAAPKEGEEGAPSRGKKIALATVKTVLWFAPAVVLLWVMGAYLGQWISAGWLIAVVAAIFVFAVPAVLNRWVKRGTYRPWLLGYSLVLIVLLVAPMPHVAGENVASYGHWPASVVAEISGAESDTAFVRSAASASESLGAWIAPGADPGWQARELGTALPLGAQWSAEELLFLMDQGELEADEFEELLGE